MKKYTLILAGLFFFANVEFSQAADNQLYSSKSESKISAKTEVLGGGKRNKDGRYRKRKGFLWGLFKGKNQCDCPKH